MNRRSILTILAYGYLFTMVVLLALFPVASRAQGTATMTTYVGTVYGGQPAMAPQATAQAACNLIGVSYNNAKAGTNVVPVSVVLVGVSACDVTYNGGVFAGRNTITATANGTASLPCPASGETKTVNFTLGFTEDPQFSKSGSVNTYADKFTSLLTAGSACVSGGGSQCSVTLTNDPSNLGSAWIASTPNAQGLYRVSQDYKVSYTGASCTPSSSEKMLTESTDAAAACSGTYGTVNGKGVCVPSSASSRNVLQSPVGTPTRRVGNPTAGSSGALPLASRTPASGTGNNDGGPASSLDGSNAPIGSPLPLTPSSGTTGGTSTTPAATNDDAKTCGLAGRPACKIDETGTPTTGTNDGQAALTDGAKSLNDTLDGIKNGNGKDTSWGVVPTWLQNVETCHPVVLMTLPERLGSKQITFDICPYMDKIYLLMNMLWVVWTFGAVISMVFRVTSAGVS